MYALETKTGKRSSTSLIKYRESEVLLFSDEQLFNLITDVESYPEFLPGWLEVNVINRDGKRIYARQKIGMPFVNWEFTSVATLEKPHHVEITSTDGPFKDLDIHWHIDPMTKNLSRVSLKVTADIDASVRSVWNIVIRQSVHSLLEHFKTRAKKLYG